MRDTKLLSDKLNVPVRGCVRYSPCDWLPKMNYLKTENGTWYNYDVSSPPVTQEQCETFEAFIDWLETDNEWIYSLGDKVVDRSLIERLNILLTTSKT